MRLTKDTKNKLSDLEKLYSSNTIEELIKTVSLELNISPESMRNIFEGKESVTPELAQRIDEVHEKEIRSQLSEKRKKAMLGKLHNRKPNLDPELGDRIDNLWEEKFGDQDKKSTEEDRKKKIDNYDELKFFEKVLAQRDFNDKLFGLQDIPNIPDLGESVTVVDCNDGKEYHTNIQTSQYLISTGLKPIWDKFNRRRRLKPGDTIGIAIDQKDNRTIYVDFEYKEREKVVKMEDDQKHIIEDIGQMEEKKVENDNEIEIPGTRRTITYSKEQRLMDIYDVIINDKKRTVFERELIPKEVDEKQFVLKYIVDECKKSYPNAKFPEIGQYITFVDKNNRLLRAKGRMDDNSYVAPRVSGVKKLIDHYHFRAYENGSEKKGDRLKFYINTEGMNNEVIVEFVRERNMDKQETQDMTIQLSQNIMSQDNEDKEIIDITPQEDEDKEIIDMENKETMETSDIENKETMKTSDDIIIMFLKNSGLIPNDISEEQMNILIDQYNPKMKASIMDAQNRALESVADDYRSQISAENERIEKDNIEKEKENLEKEKKKKEEERRVEIDKELEAISKLPFSDLERKLHDNKNVDLDGPSNVGKTSAAKRYATRYINRFVKTETNDKFQEFLEKGYIVVFPADVNLEYATFVEGFQYDNNGKPVLTPGIVKIMSNRALGSAIGLSNEDIVKNNWAETINVYKEMRVMMSKEEIDKLFKYAIPHVIIIPDFTRGDVASILGPLNTIIDKHYRLTGRDGLPVYLRDSGDMFYLPPNLYFIVDRNNTKTTGILPFDEATERRFPSTFMHSKFEDIPIYIEQNRNELENNGCYEAILESCEAMIILNKRIISKFLKDGELGHCYLYVKTQAELFYAWNNLILPLLFRHRCGRDYKALNILLFKDEVSQWISSGEGIFGLNNFEDLKNFIKRINSSENEY